MRVSVRLFASVREAIGTSQVLVDLPDAATAADLSSILQSTYPDVRGIPEARVSVNYEYVEANHVIKANDEVALIPPVSGGSAKQLLAITDQELTADLVSDLVRSPEWGAVVTFVGTARRMSRGREVSYLEYEVYPEMALRKLREIVVEIDERWGTNRVAMYHRTGRIELGEASVAIAVATEHRAEGFAACQYAIDRLKEIVPIWKKEVWAGGGEWIGWDCAEDPFAQPEPAAMESVQ
ncbi:MAG: MoaE-MoaD fusion protein [Chloroflexota bacterium]|jgi:molybdopterin synthase catalytic subunit|nr:MoaE-MoaD fusion protein [Chloroflexota bacterium]